MLATGLIVTLQVGAASVKASTNVTLDQHYPVDVTVSTYRSSLPSGTADRIARIDGITATASLQRATVTIRPAGSTRKDDSIQIPLLAGDRVNSVINTGAGTVPADRVLLDPPMAKALGIETTGKVTVRHGGRTWTMTAQPSRIAADSVAVVSPATLHRIAPDAAVGAVWAKAAPGADVTQVKAGLNQITDDNSELVVSGSLTNKATYAQLLDTLLLVATVLLGVAVVIALIGVGNTLGLSVIERTRESALLRALGLQRGQLRLMLAIEAMLLAVAGAVVGIGAGAFFGWIGTVALGQELDYDTVVFSMSVPQTLTVAAVALVAGVLASILPGRRAARSAPVDALADS
jgi:putative ABC transport system permease protein